MMKLPNAAALRVLIIDNYDSYAYNLYQRIGELTGTESYVVRNDQVTLEACRDYAPTHIVISPGPGNPEDPAYFGVCAAVILELGQRTPLLGVCLGHQGIGAVFGGRVVSAPKVMHGKTSVIEHDGTGVFSGLPAEMVAMRYHSLIVDRKTMPACLRETARTADGLIMGFVHREYPIHGVQFHPESIGTIAGPDLLRNFLALEADAR
jgi:anthranilate synthase/aminodeoxychorismate synthase-like glutamine amidotransferase